MLKQSFFIWVVPRFWLHLLTSKRHKIVIMCVDPTSDGRRIYSYDRSIKIPPYSPKQSTDQWLCLDCICKLKFPLICIIQYKIHYEVMIIIRFWFINWQSTVYKVIQPLSLFFSSSQEKRVRAPTQSKYLINIP